MRTRCSLQHVVTLISDGKSYDRLVHALERRALLERALDWNGLIACLAGRPFAVVVLELTAVLSHTIHFTTLVRSRKVARLVLACNLDLAAIESVFRFRPYADELIVLGAHDDATIQRRVLSDSSIENVIGRVRSILEDRVAPELARYLEWCLARLESKTDGRLTVSDMAHDFGRTRESIQHVFMSVVRHPPRLMVALVQAVVALALSEDQERSVSRLAEELRFSSAASLCQSIRQATGMTIGQIRVAGGTAHLAELFAERFGARGGRSAIGLCTTPT